MKIALKIIVLPIYQTYLPTVSVKTSIYECLNYKLALVITALMFAFFPLLFFFFILEIKGHSREGSSGVKVFHKVSDYNGNGHSSPQRGW